MASFSIGMGQTLNGPYTLNDSNTGSIAYGGILAPLTSTPGVTFSFVNPGATASVSNFGKIDAQYGDAIYGASANLTNFSTVSITNQGTGQIISSAIALDFPLTTASGTANLFILNAGTISGTMGAVWVAGIATSSFNNSGFVTGEVSLGANLNGLGNSGLIVGDVNFSGTVNTLSDSGAITGDVNFTGGNDTATVSGSVGGKITFAGGDDSLTLVTGSSVGGAIDGGAGANVLKLTGAGSGAVGNLSHFQTVDLQGGAWTLNSETMQTVTFDGATTVTLGHSTLTDGSFAAQINNFAEGDSVVLEQMSGYSTATLGPNNVLVLSGDSPSLTLNLDPSYDYTGKSFQLSTDSAGDTIVTVICFYPGVMIATPDGEVAVETLRAGDLVATADGRVAKIRWMGRQTVSTRFGDQLRTLPVRIRAGALGGDLPVRDLLVSPDHALLIDGVLVHAGALVNGVSITREHDVPEVFTYWHIETADHSLVLAEGVAAETFIDNVERRAFDNWEEHVAADVAAPIAEMTYPRVKSARQLPLAIRRRIADFDDSRAA